MAENYRPSLDDPNVWVPYRYHPSRTAAIVFVVAFSMTTIIHSAQVVRKRTWYFIPLIIGGIFEVVGFVGRILSTNDLWALGPYIMQSLLLLVAPALFAASVYIVLGRIILLTNGEEHSLIRQRWLTKIFVTGDVISFLTQCCGGGIQAAGTLSLLHTGEKIIIVGLFLQLAFFGFFVFVAGLFHFHLLKATSLPLSKHSNRHSNHQPSFASYRDHATGHHSLASSTTLNIHDLPWKRHIYALYTASALIMIRSVFRVIEYIQGNNGYLLRHEVFLYVFDALLMIIVMILFNWIHPAQVTDLYQKRMTEDAGLLLEETRERYVGSGDRHMAISKSKQSEV